MVKQLTILMVFAFSLQLALAKPLPYDATADANAMVKQALSDAAATNKTVLLIFGANWCEDCRALDRALHVSKNAQLIAHDFVVVKVDVGNFDHNLDIDRAYGHPIKMGIPAAVVLSPGNKVIYATRGGELADARRMSNTGIYDFFKQVVELYSSK